jgi:basic amino acid/polyamine antiporter, APA family
MKTVGYLNYMKTYHPESHHPFGYSTATAVVIASMIGTGVFTTLGLEAQELKTGFSLMCLWLAGGLIALAGALSYGELAAAMPRSGGEYHFLGKIYHPVLGIVAGWISVTIGFAAPSALAAMAFSRYASAFTDAPLVSFAVLVLVGVTAFHAFSVNAGKRFHIVTTAAKVLLIAGFCVTGLLVVPAAHVTVAPSVAGWHEVFSPSFAFSLIYVSYAYSGWNAATYIISEVNEPQRVVPVALFHGTLIVMVLYLLLNLVFLCTVPPDELAGKLEIGALSAQYIFGEYGRLLASAMICVLLLSTISAMVMAGPRVLQVAGEDLPGLQLLAARTRSGTPLRAILLQLSIAIAFVVTDSFEGVLSYAGFTLNLITILTVAGVFVLRRSAPDMPRPYRVWGYPLTPAVFVLLNSLILVFVLQARPVAACTSLLTVLLGALLAWLHIRRGA